jgi:flagellar biosynthesis anti-sigma factor FlgM
MAMDVRNNLEGLKTLLGIPALASTPAQQVKSDAAPASNSLAGDHATLSSAGAEAAQAASASSDVRMEKVAAVQAALNAGTYQVPATAVAGKMVYAMLESGQPPSQPSDK